jgi:hypothetical protein
MLTRAILLSGALLYVSSAQSQTFAVAGGQTIRSSITQHDAYRVEINFGWKPEIWSNENWALSLNHAIGLMTFRDINNLDAISWAPNLILTPSGKTGFYPYAQLGFGVAYLSEDKFKSEPTPHPNPLPWFHHEGSTDMGSHAQFESSFALGLTNNRFGIRAKIYHYSNAGLADKNEGMDVAEFGISYSF